MTLLDDLIHLGDRYRVDWVGTQGRVRQRLCPTPALEAGVLEPETFPGYWCLPLLLGDYIGAPGAAIEDDLEPFVSGSLIRHFFFDTPPRFEPEPSDRLLAAVAAAYRDCRIEVAGAAFEERFSAKCRPWKALLLAGSDAIRAQASEPSELDQALRAIIEVFSCLQIVDDWHDRADDASRRHWNIWADEPAEAALAAIEALVPAAGRAVQTLRPHLLRRALAEQLADTVHELNDIVTVEGQTPARQDRIGARSSGRRRSSDGIDRAIEGGAEFLRDRMRSEPVPLWRDFARAGVSDGSTECISAFVAAQLSPVPEGGPLARAVAGHLVAQSRPAGGWGYRGDVPADCDSTAWVLLAASANGCRTPTAVLRQAWHFILAHQHQSGGFATYRHEAKASLTRADATGWFKPEVSVTASAVAALARSEYPDATPVEAGLRFLAAQSVGGAWSSFWWRGSSYATFVCSSAFIAASRLGADAVLRVVQAALLRDRRTDGGWSDRDEASEPFATALAVKTLLLGARPMTIDALGPPVAFLLAGQEATGGWPASAWMVAPGAADGADIELRDSGIVTTACVVSALHSVRMSRRWKASSVSSPGPARA